MFLKCIFLREQYSVRNFFEKAIEKNIEKTWKKNKTMKKIKLLWEKLNAWRNLGKTIIY